MIHSRTLTPRSSSGDAPIQPDTPEVWALAVVWAPFEPGRIGEVLLFPSGACAPVMLLGRGVKKVHAIDFSEAMLEAGRAKLPPDAPVVVQAADARELPLPDACVDGVICGFGLRNVPELPRAVAECARVLRPGGRLVVLDFFKPTGSTSRALQAGYNRVVMPAMGGLITGFGAAYRYLAGSIDAFETRQGFEAL